MQATISSKAQITLPKELREFLAVKTGDKLEFTVLSDGSARMARARVLSFSSLRGILAQPTRALSIEEMNESMGTLLKNDDQRIKNRVAPE